jgi:membrane protein
MRAPANLFSRFTRSVSFYAKGLYRRFNEENVLFLASGIAFNIILCLLPLLLLLTAVLGTFLNSSHVQLEKIDEVLSTIFPPQPYARQIQNSIRNILGEIVRYRSTFGFYGLGVLVWTATSLFSSIRIVVNRIYRFKPSRIVILSIVEDTLLVIVMGGLFLVANAFTWMLAFVNSLLREIPALGGVDLISTMKTLTFAGSYLSAFVMFYILNRSMPEKGVPTKVALLAAFTTSSLWWIASKGFAWYLVTFRSYSNLYGTYTFMLVFLVWVYFSSLVFIVGVIVGQLYRERLRPPGAQA